MLLYKYLLSLHDPLFQSQVLFSSFLRPGEEIQTIPLHEVSLLLARKTRISGKKLLPEAGRCLTKTKEHPSKT